MLSHINVYVFSGQATNSKRPTYQQSASRRPQVRQHNFLTGACVPRPALICILMWLIANTHTYTRTYICTNTYVHSFDIPTRNLKLPQRCLPEWRLTAQTSLCLLWFLCYFAARTWWWTAIPEMSRRQAPPHTKKTCSYWACAPQTPVVEVLWSRQKYIFNRFLLSGVFTVVYLKPFRFVFIGCLSCFPSDSVYYVGFCWFSTCSATADHFSQSCQHIWPLIMFVHSETSWKKKNAIVPTEDCR